MADITQQLIEPLNLRRISVPLDGSAAAEVALHYAVQMARWFDAEINLLHVVRSLREAEPRVTGVRYQDRYHDRGVQLASAYAEEVVKKISPYHKNVRWGVATGETAEVIANRAVFMKIGMIVMKYRHRPFSERITETIFDHLWRITPVPILVVKAELSEQLEKRRVVPKPARIIANVNDTAILACILPYLRLLVALTKADVDIVYPLPNVGRLSVRNAYPPIENTELDDAIIELRDLGSKVSVLFAPEPLKTVQVIHKRHPSCWNITASRMRSRVSRAMMKSVAHQLVVQSAVPTLIVPFGHVAARRIEIANRPRRTARPTTRI